MPAVTLGNKKLSQVKAVETGYAGDTPPSGSYIVKSGKTWIAKTTRNGDTMLSVPLQISEPKGSKKAKYNGYTIWHNLTLAESSAPFVNAFLKACNIDPAKIHGGKYKVDGGKNGAQNIVGIQGVEMVNTLVVRAVPKSGDYDGLDVKSAAPYTEKVSSADESDDEWDSDEDEQGDDADDFEDDDEESF